MSRLAHARHGVVHNYGHLSKLGECSICLDRCAGTRKLIYSTIRSRWGQAMWDVRGSSLRVEQLQHMQCCMEVVLLPLLPCSAQLSTTQTRGKPAQLWTGPPAGLGCGPCSVLSLTVAQNKCSRNDVCATAHRHQSTLRRKRFMQSQQGVHPALPDWAVVPQPGMNDVPNLDRTLQ